jgi:hypothetical protein
LGRLSVEEGLSKCRILQGNKDRLSPQPLKGSEWRHNTVAMGFTPMPTTKE